MSQPLDEHIAGRGARHPWPPGELDVPVAVNALTPAFQARWVEPFYLDLLGGPANFAPAPARAFVAAARAADDGVIDALLADTGWRSRLVGAWFIALRGAEAFEERLGRLLLRSDTCYAGRAYSLALAAFGTPTAAAFLERYLQHYLAHPEFDFDQAEALAALRRIEAEHSGTRAAALQPAWDRFATRWPQRLARAEAELAAQLDALSRWRTLPLATAAPMPAPAAAAPPVGWRSRWRRWFAR